MDLFSESEGSSSSRSVTPTPEVSIVQSRDAIGEADFNINTEYAARYQHNKQRTELHQLEEKYKGSRGDDGSEDESSSEEETEDEEGEQVTADVDAAILSTLAKIRRKDESIYEAGKRVFEEERQLASKSKLLPRMLSSGSNNKKKVTLAEYQRSRIQELIKTSDDPARDLAEATMIQRRQQGGLDYEAEEDSQSGPLTHTKEQEQLRKEVTNAFHSMGDDEAEDFFTKKDGEDGDEGANDPEAYRAFLLGVLGGKDKEQAVREILRAQTEEASAGDVPVPARGKAPKVRIEDGTEEENEEFLMNYVLNRGWVENPQAAPKGKKKASQEKISGKAGDAEEGFSDVSSEDSFDSRAEAFENAYNFRFEEMERGEAEAQIQSYARNPIGSVRRKEDKRKVEREERAKRKEEEKGQKKKEIDRMRNLKRKSIVERLRKLKEATGSSNVDFERFEMDQDFDPEEHDRLMQKAFDEEYYGEEDGDMKKPKWDDDIDFGEVEERNGKGKKRRANIEMDADYLDEDGPLPEKKLSKAEKKKLKKKEKAKAKKQGEQVEVNDEEMDAEVVNEVEQLNPAERKMKMDQAMDEYYGLDYEDMIGDQPTRFKYTQVPQSSFGLTAEEILLADDDDLKNVVSLKRLQPYRDGKKRPSDLNARLKEFRRKFNEGVEKHGEQSEPEEKPKAKRMGKRERERRKEAAAKAAESNL